MGILIFFLTALIVLDCLFLMLLVLVQLPKKEAGMGTAFGGGATDALFGAGSGNVLTKLTKYSTGIFLGLALLLSVLIINQSKRPARSLDEELRRKASAPAVAPAAIVPATNMLTMTNLAPQTAPVPTTPEPPKADK